MTGGDQLSPTGKESDVQMVDEHVNLLLGMRQCNVDAVFHLRNWGKTKKLEVGFPFQYESDLQNFRVWVNDAPVKVSEAKRGSGSTIYRQYWDKTNWKLWTEHIRHGEVQTVRVTYTVTPERNEPQLAGTEDTEDKFPQWGKMALKYGVLNRYYGPMYPEEECPQYWNNAALMSITRDLSTSYTLRSGQPWKGKINECIVEANWKDFSNWKPAEMLPDGPALTVKPGYSKWTFKNLEPTEDIKVRLEHRIRRADFARAYKESALNHLNDYFYCSTVCGALVAFGDMAGAMDVAKKSLEKWTPESIAKASSSKASAEHEQTGYLEMAEFLEAAYKDQGDLTQSAVYRDLRQKILATK